MQVLSPERKLEIARRVHETFDLPKRRLQGGWGRDKDGCGIGFARGAPFLGHERPCLNALIAWNDDDARSRDVVRTLTAAVAHRLQAQA